MKSHKVIEIKVTYIPEDLKAVSQDVLEAAINASVADLKSMGGVKVTTKKYDVEVRVSVDEYGIDLETE